MNPETNSIHIFVQVKPGEIEPGILTYLEEGPEIFLANGDCLEKGIGYDGITFSVRDSTGKQALKLTPEEKVMIDPIYLGVLSFSENPIEIDEMYPKSSQGWLCHVSGKGKEVVVTAQGIENSKKILLVFSDMLSGKILQSFRKNVYEINLLNQLRDFTVHNTIVERDYEGDTKFISSILNGKSPNWKQISRLVKDVNIPELEIKETMRETISQLVPDSFPDDIKDELMAFMGWSITATIPKQDPLFYSERFLTKRIFSTLFTRHLQCILENIEPPQYVRTMFLADRGMLHPPKSPIVRSVESSPWLMALHKLTEDFPDSLSKVIVHAEQLTTKGMIVTKLPVSKTDATKSKKAWSNRYAMFIHGLALRADVNNLGIGLKEVIYVGGAHKWPHKHLSWSARLGQAGGKARQFQVMMMPPNASSVVAGTGSNITEISWAKRKSNLNLYDVKKRKWTMSIPRLHRSIASKRTLSQLRKEFTRFKSSFYKISKIECEVLDLISYGMYLHHLETGKYAKYLGLKQNQMKTIMNSLLEKQLIDPHYIPFMQGISSIMIEARGTPNSICGIVRAFLNNTPSANAFITDNGKKCYIISRLPEENAFDIVTQTPGIAEAIDVKLTCLPIRAYSGYRNNLYSRLWLDEGVWDSDLSGLLDQMSPR